MKKSVHAIAAALLAVGLLTACDGEDTEGPADSSADEQTSEDVDAESSDDDAEEAEDDVPKEFKSALASAENYLNILPMSKAGLFKQLSSEHGDKFTEEAAEYAVESIDADWKEKALESAHIYQDDMDMSPAAIHEQLMSEHGDQFTEEEADYAIENLD